MHTPHADDVRPEEAMKLLDAITPEDTKFKGAVPPHEGDEVLEWDPAITEGGEHPGGPAPEDDPEEQFDDIHGD